MGDTTGASGGERAGRAGAPVLSPARRATSLLWEFVMESLCTIVNVICLYTDTRLTSNSI